jgi:Raf kinase inhibitor-like YbhB/YbcL family protein
MQAYRHFFIGFAKLLFLWIAFTESTIAGSAPFELGSADLPAGKSIPQSMVANEFSCAGSNQSPDLEWKNAPPGTRSFAITMFDSNTPPSSGWWHWIVFDIPASSMGLQRNAGTLVGGLPAGARQARPDGSSPEPRYYGPCPTRGDAPHPYIITVYALDTDHLDAPLTSTAANIDYEISIHTLAKASIVRHFARPRVAH